MIPVLFLPILTDPAYYAPQEVAQRLHGWLSSRTNDLVDAAFQSNQMPYYVAAHRMPRPDSYTPTWMVA